MRVVEARYEEGTLRPTAPLSLRPGETVNLIVIRRPDPRRWVERLTAADAAEELELTEQGLADWVERLDEEDRG